MKNMDLLSTFVYILFRLVVFYVDSIDDFRGIGLARLLRLYYIVWSTRTEEWTR